MKYFVDLCCGKGTWCVPGRRYIGYDVVNYGYPGELILQDVRTVSGVPLRGACAIVASPPCDGFTDLPWRPATGKGLDIVEACIRIAKEAHVPFIMENNRFLQKYIGKAVCHRGPFYFWGDVPQLPIVPIRKKESMSSTWRMERAAIPFPIAEAVAAVFG